MVSLGTGINLTLAAIVALGAFLLIKNAGAIGSFIGGGLNQFGSNILGGISGIGSGVTDFFTNTSEEQIVSSLGLENQTTGVPEGGGIR